MASNLLWYQLLLTALVLIWLRMHVWWPDHPHPTPRRSSSRRSPGANALQNPNPSLDASINHGATRVSRASMLILRHLGRHLPCASFPGDADAPSTPRSIAVRITIAPMTAGSGAATSAPMAPTVASSRSVWRRMPAVPKPLLLPLIRAATQRFAAVAAFHATVGMASLSITRVCK
jgi:hypothetical protein